MLLKVIHAVLLCVLLCGLTTQSYAATTLPEDSKKAVILAYMRVGEDHLPDSNLTVRQFQEHIQLIEQGEYIILPLPEILEALENDQNLPSKTLAITFDGAYKSAYTNAFPILEEKNIPFTIFYSSESADRKYPEYIGWPELKKLSRNPHITLGVLPVAYEHTAHKSKTEFTADLNIARQKHRDTFNSDALFLAYPYGEYSNDLQKAASSRGFKAAFGLHAGAIYTGSDIFSLPRFTMTERYGDEERFKLVANALPLPVSDITPEDPFIHQKSFQAGFTVPEALSNEINGLSCFLSGLPEPETQILGRRVEVRSVLSTLENPRFRLNCTMQGPQNASDEPQWRWFSMLFHRDTESDFMPEGSNTLERDALLPPQE